MSASDVKIGLMLRAHRRSFTLDIALSVWREIGTWPGFQTKISVMTDRPTPEVLAVLDKHKNYLFNILESPCELVSPTGEHFMEATSRQLTGFINEDLDWLAMVDDDYWPEVVHAREEFPEALRNEDVDMYYARCLFFWDTTSTFNPARHHCSPLFFRPLAGDSFPPDRERIIHATALRHDDAILTGRTAVLATPLLEYGSLTSQERQTLLDTYSKAGKSDAFTAPLAAPSPRLLHFPADAVRLGILPTPRWRDLYLEKLNGSL